MAQNVYSVRLLTGVGAGLYTYTVPPGNVVVVRDLDLTFQPSFASHVATLTVAGAEIWIDIESDLVTAKSVEWRGRQVANPGDAIQVFSDGDMSFGLSGYLLGLP
jgi:hypothetical protein